MKVRFILCDITIRWRYFGNKMNEYQGDEIDRTFKHESMGKTKQKITKLNAKLIQSNFPVKRNVSRG